MQTFFDTFPITIEANGIYRLNSYNRFICLLESSTATAIPVAIGGGGPKGKLEKGIAVELPAGDKFSHILFQNPVGTSITLKVALSPGRIYDNRLVISSEVDVDDTSNDIETPAPITVLKPSYLIDNAAAVDKGGGKVGIPVTGQPFAIGEGITIAGTTNYNGNHTVDATSTANEVVITATYQAEVFAGTETIALTTPRSIAADSTQKEVIIENTGGGGNTIWVGDSNVDAATKRGKSIADGDAVVFANSAKLYLQAESTGESTASYTRNQKV